MHLNLLKIKQIKMQTENKNKSLCTFCVSEKHNMSVNCWIAFYVKGRSFFNCYLRAARTGLREMFYFYLVLALVYKDISLSLYMGS